MDGRLAYARELEQRDAEVASRIESVQRIGRAADELRARAEALAREAARLPEDRERVAAAAAEAERALASARARLVEAQNVTDEVDEAGRLRLAHATSELRAAEGRHGRLVARAVALASDEDRLRREADELRGAAGRLAGELGSEPRIAAAASPPAELEAMAEWATRAHAAVLVARSGLESERDRIVREANELASSVLGQALQATSAASARGQLERALD